MTILGRRRVLTPGRYNAGSWVFGANPPSSGWSLRALKPGIGSVVQVRRADNNGLADIGVDSNGNFDTAALITHCTSPATDGFVQTWYDQFDGNNLIQPTQTTQPKIYDSITGVVAAVSGNNRPTIRFGNGPYMYVDDTAVLKPTDELGYICISTPENSKDSAGIMTTTPLGQQNFSGFSNVIHTTDSIMSGGTFHYFVSSVDRVLNEAFTFQSYITSPPGSMDSYIMVNDTVDLRVISRDLAQFATAKFTVGAFYGIPNVWVTGLWDGTIEEVIVYEADKRNLAKAIRAETQGYYG
jgi:hypothetical protein